MPPSNGAGAAPVKTPSAIGIPIAGLDDPEEPVGDRKVVARVHRVYQGTITRWVKDGMKPIVGGGRGKPALFRLSDTVAFRIAQLEARTAGLDGLSVNPALERALKDRAQRRLADQLRRRRAGEVLEVEDVKRTWMSLVIATRQKLLALPRGLAERLTNLPEPAAVEAILREGVHDALRELAAKGSAAVAEAAGEEEHPGGDGAARRKRSKQRPHKEAQP